MEPCPSHACTVVSGTPLMSRSQAAVCRRSWRVRPRPGRAAARAATEAAGEHRATADAVRRCWGGLPTGAQGVESWAEAFAGKRADADVRVTQLRREAAQAPP